MRLAASEGAPVRWILDVDCPLLNRVDAWLVTDGRAGPPMLMGNAFAFPRRPLPSRSQASELMLDGARPQRTWRSGEAASSSNGCSPCATGAGGRVH